MARVCGRPGSVVVVEALGQDPDRVRPWEFRLPRWKGRRKQGSLLRALWNLACTLFEFAWWLLSWTVILVWRLLDRRKVTPENRAKVQAGAHGEARVADLLEGLSDEFWVLHDVRLVAFEPIQFDGVGLHTAQLDHVVVGPTGVFVIEAKCWAKDHAAAGDAFSPFQQVRRAGYLCYRLLKDHIGETKVNKVVVPVGAPLKPIDGHHVDLVWPSKLCRWIEGGKASLPPERVEQVARFLGLRVATHQG